MAETIKSYYRIVFKYHLFKGSILTQAMFVAIHSHKLLVEGSPPNPFERRISLCGCAFCERFLQLPPCPVLGHRDRQSNAILIVKTTYFYYQCVNQSNWVVLFSP